MHIIATAGHVDHGKSTLVRVLTGMEPDRWAEERRRGMTLDLGFAWTALPSGEPLAFVDVPGHERFVPTMLAGVGPVPAVLLVVAADEGWMPQSAEHLAALDALNVQHGLVAVTRSDLADPRPAAQRAWSEVSATSLGDVEVLPVSAVTGAGLDPLRAALDRLVTRLPAPDRTAPARLWVDRSFTIQGSGTVVTGTLAAGRLRRGNELEIGGTGELVGVRALQALGAEELEVVAVARVGVNLRGVGREKVRRGDALVTPDRFSATSVVDARVHGCLVSSLPSTLTLHIGSAAVPARIRPLGIDTARLGFGRRMPLRLGDRGLLRDPSRRVVVGGITVLDVAPEPLRRRGAAAARAVTLATMHGRADERAELRRRRLIRRGDLERMGIPVSIRPVVGEWLADPDHWDALRHRLHAEVMQYASAHPLDSGASVEALRRTLDLPDRALVEALVAPPLIARNGRVSVGGRPELPDAVAHAVQRISADLAEAPFRAPEATRLAELGLGKQQLAAAVRAGALLQIADRVVLLPNATAQAVRILAELPQPFTLSSARQAIGTTRRVAVPLLELLDRTGATRRLPDGRRIVDKS